MARLFLFALFLALTLPASQAQSPPRANPAPPADANRSDPKAKPPSPPPAPVTLDSLFEKLAKAKDPQEGRAIAAQIERRWQRSGSDTTDLLMSRAIQLLNGKEHEQALDMLDYIIQLRPGWAEAYNKRATLFFTMDDLDGAMRDIRATLAREPRHFGALAGLGLIFQKMDNPKAAHAAFTQALKLHPQMERLQGMLDRLKLDVEERRL
ncbi:MAG TPA: hypothetical protein PK812_03450 [Beijerinckiaceae bacterium]|nr:hypothetical protein [Beijerinckiaceae bacterium]